MPLARAKQAFLDELGSFGVEYPAGSYDREIANSFPASDPPTGDASHELEPVAVAVADPEPMSHRWR